VEVKQLIDHQIKVKITNQGGVLTVALPDNQAFKWPIKDVSIPTGEYFITLSSHSKLPEKEELPRLVLKELLQKDH